MSGFARAEQALAFTSNAEIVSICRQKLRVSVGLLFAMVFIELALFLSYTFDPNPLLIIIGIAIALIALAVAVFYWRRSSIYV